MLLLWWILTISESSAGRKPPPPPVEPPPPAGDTLAFAWAPGDTAQVSSIHTHILEGRSITTVESGTLRVQAAPDSDALVVDWVDAQRHTDSLGFSPVIPVVLAARDALPWPAFRIATDGRWLGLVDITALSVATFAAADSVRADLPPSLGAEAEDAIRQYLDPMAIGEAPNQDWERCPGGFLGRFLPAGEPLVQQVNTPTLVGTLPMTVTVEHRGEAPCSDSGPGQALRCVKVRLWVEPDPTSPAMAQITAQGGSYTSLLSVEWRLDPQTLHPWWESASERIQITAPGAPPVDRTISHHTTYLWQ